MSVGNNDDERYPHGKLNPFDEGAIRIAVGIENNAVIVEFPKPVKWFGLDKATALRLAEMLKNKAEQLVLPS